LGHFWTRKLLKTLDRHMKQYWQNSLLAPSRIHCDTVKPEPNWRISVNHVSLSGPDSQVYKLHVQACHLKWLETVLYHGWSEIVCYLNQTVN
jgi:hypothetical protein